jgi:hypothetical protein
MALSRLAFQGPVSALILFLLAPPAGELPHFTGPGWGAVSLVLRKIRLPSVAPLLLIVGLPPGILGDICPWEQSGGKEK